MYGVIGDVHLGAKPYDDHRRALEIVDAFELALDKLSDMPLILIQELFDSTVIPNWIYKRLLYLKEVHRDQRWLILGGNHDSTKTYDSVSALDAFAEIYNVEVVNSHEAKTVSIVGTDVLCIPHMRSQTEFLTAIDDLLATNQRWDACMLHAMLDSKLDLGPNDLNLDLGRVLRLSHQCGRVWLGHEHKPKEVEPNKVYQTGSTLELDFGELGPRYVYRVEDGVVNKVKLASGRPMIKLQYDWTGPVPLLTMLDTLNTEAIYKIEINGVPVEEYSAAVNVCDAYRGTGLKIFDIRKLGQVELKVTAIKAQFNLLTEFDLFAAEAQLDDADEMRVRLVEAIEQTLIEDEEAPI